MGSASVDAAACTRQATLSRCRFRPRHAGHVPPCADEREVATIPATRPKQVLPSGTRLAQLQIDLFGTPSQASQSIAHKRAYRQGCRAAAAASDCDAVLQPIRSVSDLIADSARKLTAIRGGTYRYR